MHEKKNLDFLEGEILLVNKPYQWTSFDVIKKIRGTLRKVLNRKNIKVGHAGTLDPLASGLLILCTGKFTRQISAIQEQEKEYVGAIYLGATTPSFDLETEVEQEFDISGINETMIYEAAGKFQGEILQEPPVFSALKYKGKTMYNLARKGKDVKAEARPVVISSFEITEIKMPLIKFKITCSKGTYIRSIANDFGKALNIGGYLHELKRTRIGEFNLADAWKVHELVEHINKNKELILHYAGFSGSE